MPNAAKVGLILGVSLVIAIGAVFFRKELGNNQPGPDRGASNSAVPGNALPSDPTAPRGSGAATVPGSQSAERPLSGRYHTVRQGDTLFNLAQTYYGDGERFIDIYRANRQALVSPDQLPAGTILLIPDLRGDAYVKDR